MFDGTTATFETVKRSDTVMVIAVVGDKIISVYEEQPDHVREFGLLGGRVNDGEEPLDAAKRELMEESGLVSENMEHYKTYTPFHRIIWSMHVFIARDCRKAGEPKLESGERITLREMSFEEFVESLSLQQWGELTNDILRMKAEGTLPEFRKKLFGNT